MGGAGERVADAEEASDAGEQATVSRFLRAVPEDARLPAAVRGTGAVCAPAAKAPATKCGVHRVLVCRSGGVGCVVYDRVGTRRLVGWDERCVRVAAIRNIDVGQDFIAVNA